MNTMSTIEENICKNVKYYRIQLQMTQKDVANILKISLSSYQKLEQGQRHFSTSQLFELSQIFDVNIACLYDRLNLDVKTNYKSSSADVLKINMQKILKCFGIEDFTIKDISTLINFLRKKGRNFLYVSKTMSDYWQYEIDKKLGDDYLAENLKWHYAKTQNELERYYEDNLPFIKRQIADMIREFNELETALTSGHQLKISLNDEITKYESTLENLKKQYDKYTSESESIEKERLAQLQKQHQKAIQELLHQKSEIQSEIYGLIQRKQQLSDFIDTVIPLEQYIYNPNTIDKNIYEKISDCIPLVLQEKLNRIIIENDNLQYDLSLFEDYGFDIDDVSEKSIAEFVNNKIQEYCKKEFHDWTWSKISKVTFVLFQYIKKYGLLKEYKEKDKNLSPRYTTPEEILDYYLRYH